MTPWMALGRGAGPAPALGCTQQLLGAGEVASTHRGDRVADHPDALGCSEAVPVWGVRVCAFRSMAVCVEAGMLALRRQGHAICHEDFVEAITIVGAKKKGSLDYFA